ncbi:hypothetical protein [Kitasatospora sp. NPDC050463]|uniref:hypothetical protein n=1 Tax=Kitasatospora sp. NPDC050463 TaxID=3155786 RepID=UPI0033E259F5
MRAVTADELIGAGPPAVGRPAWDGHPAYLIARFNEGCHSALRLHRELTERGPDRQRAHRPPLRAPAA